MRISLVHLIGALSLSTASFAQAQTVTTNIPYAQAPHARQVLDVHAPAGAADLPVLFWIHGGGWQQGDKSHVARKPAWFMEKGCVFVSTNYRLWPSVEMEILISDVAKAMRWVRDHIAEHGGDPSRILVGGHSAGAQLAAILCTDEKYLKAEGLSLDGIKGCVPVDGDTYDIPAMIETAETRLRVHGFPPPRTGHRVKFGDDPAKHKDFSAAHHVARGKGIPPFLILYVANHPDNSIQARRFESALKEGAVPVTLFGAKDTDHVKLNDKLGTPADPATKAVEDFMAKCLFGRN